MTKVKLLANLSVDSIKELKQKLERVKPTLDYGRENFVEYATQRLYDLVIQECSKYNISNPSGRINAEYDKNNKIGRVYTSDMVIILNEFGTGIRGIQDEWANKYGYQVNQSGKGAEGWVYPKDDDTFGFTHGLDSRHMFYNAYLQIQLELGEMIEMTIGKALGDLY